MNVKKNALHEEMEIPAGEKIGKKRLESEKAMAEREGNKQLVERTTFALNFNKHDPEHVRHARERYARSPKF